jgi:putative transposase
MILPRGVLSAIFLFMRRVQNLLDRQFEVSLEHGGELGAGRRKSRRPLATKKAMFVTFKSSAACEKYSFHRYQGFIHQTIATLAGRFGIKVYEYSLNSNHLHMLLKGDTRDGLQNFFRSLPALIARKITGACKGNPFGKRFWDFVNHSRIVQGRKAFIFALNYIIQNQEETTGEIPYTPRNRRRPDN